MWPFNRTSKLDNPMQTGGGDQYINFPQLLRNRLYGKLTWNEVERAWLRLKKEAVDGANFCLRKGLEHRLKESFTGCFLHHLNKFEETTPELQQKKLDIAQFLLRINEFPTVYQRRHDYTENIMSLLVDTVTQSKTGMVTEKSILKNMASLRLAGSKIGRMDYTLKGCSGLEALILTSNFITDFDGVVLPQNLKLLELYGNLLQDVALLAKNAPKKLLFLGLGRNYLSRATSLTQLNKYIYLCYLDLSDNDFENLEELLRSLKNIKRLKSLMLIGNPCSVLCNYKEIVTVYLPKIELLDGSEVIDYSTQIDEPPAVAVLQIYGFKFIGVPKPRTLGKRTKVEPFYQLEVELPLLDPDLAENEANILMHELNGIPLPVVPVIDSIPKNIERPNRKSHARVFKPSMDGTRKKRKSKRADSVAYRLHQQEAEMIEQIEDKYYELIEGDEEIERAKKFLSHRTQWAPIMKFVNPAISVIITKEQIRMLRDTFRSIINLRLYYKEETQNTGQSIKRSTTFSKKTKFGSKKKDSSMTKKKYLQKTGTFNKIKGSSEFLQKKSRVSSQMKIITRNLICKIPIPLQITKWSEDYMGYTWDIKEHCLAKPFPGLKNMSFGGRKRSRLDKKSSRVSREDSMFFNMPKMLTCHVGVGLMRTGTNDRMRIASKISRMGKASRSDKTIQSIKKESKKKLKNISRTSRQRKSHI